MANYDDIFNASAQKDTEDKSFISFNKEEWAAQKKQERESAFAMIDETAQRMVNDGGLFQARALDEKYGLPVWTQELFNDIAG